MTKIDNTDFRKKYKEHLKYLTEHPEVAELMINVDKEGKSHYFQSLIMPKNNAELLSVMKVYEFHVVINKITEAIKEGRLPKIAPEENEGIIALVDIYNRILKEKDLETVVKDLHISGAEYGKMIYDGYIGFGLCGEESLSYLVTKLNWDLDSDEGIDKIMNSLFDILGKVGSFNGKSLSKAEVEDLELFDEVTSELDRLYNLNLMPAKSPLERLVDDMIEEVFNKAKEDMLKRNNPLIDDEFILDKKIEDDSYKFPSR